jgi:hypothetical protein
MMHPILKLPAAEKQPADVPVARRRRKRRLLLYSFNLLSGIVLARFMMIIYVYTSLSIKKSVINYDTADYRNVIVGIVNKDFSSPLNISVDSLVVDAYSLDDKKQFAFRARTSGISIRKGDSIDLRGNLRVEAVGKDASFGNLRYHFNIHAVLRLRICYIAFILTINKRIVQDWSTCSNRADYKISEVRVIERGDELHIGAELYGHVHEPEDSSVCLNVSSGEMVLVPTRPALINRVVVEPFEIRKGAFSRIRIWGVVGRENGLALRNTVMRFVNSEAIKIPLKVHSIGGRVLREDIRFVVEKYVGRSNIVLSDGKNRKLGGLVRVEIKNRARVGGVAPNMVHCTVTVENSIIPLFTEETRIRYSEGSRYLIEDSDGNYEVASAHARVGDETVGEVVFKVIESDRLTFLAEISCRTEFPLDGKSFLEFDSSEFFRGLEYRLSVDGSMELSYMGRTCRFLVPNGEGGPECTSPATTEKREPSLKVEEDRLLLKIMGYTCRVEYRNLILNFVVGNDAEVHERYYKTLGFDEAERIGRQRRGMAGPAGFAFKNNVLMCHEWNIEEMKIVPEERDTGSLVPTLGLMLRLSDAEGSWLHYGGRSFCSLKNVLVSVCLGIAEGEWFLLELIEMHLRKKKFCEGIEMERTTEEILDSVLDVLRSSMSWWSFSLLNYLGAWNLIRLLLKRMSPGMLGILVEIFLY